MSFFICPSVLRDFTLFCQKLANAFKEIQTLDCDVYTNTVLYTGLLKKQANLTLNIFEPKRKKLELLKECKEWK